VCRAWLDAGGERELVRDAIAAWLKDHATDAEADFLCRAWLEARGSFSLVKLPAIRWLSQHCHTAEAVYLTKVLAKQRDLPAQTVVDILTWCRTFAIHEDAIWRLTQLRGHLLNADIGEEVVVASEAVLEPLIFGDTPLDSVTRGQITALFSYLIEAPGLDWGELRHRVDDLLVAWLRAPASFGTSPHPHGAIQRLAYVRRIADLLDSGAVSVSSDREHLERFLRWVDTWQLRWKAVLAPVIDSLRRNYPAPGLWDIIELG
jgi:hypothetical protein